MSKQWLHILIGIFVSIQTGWSVEWNHITPPVDFSFPRDHGAHYDTKVEWWYFTGNLESSSGRQFGIQVTFFRHGLEPENNKPNEAQLKAKQLIIGHLAIADIQNKKFHFTQRMRRAGAGFANAATDEMHVWLGDWELQQNENTLHFQGSAPNLDATLSIKWKPLKPLAKHGKNGYSQKGDDPGNASAYISYTRLETHADLQWKGKTYTLQGLSWFDHEWGTSQLGEDVVGWDWWGLHLDDGRDLMIYQLRKNDGTPIPQSSGTLVNADGTTEHISVKEFTLTPLEYWESPNTDARYPIRWEIEIPKKKLQFQITPKLHSSEMGTDETSGIIYWEGPVECNGSATGSGYMELTGYTEILKNQF